MYINILTSDADKRKQVKQESKFKITENEKFKENEK